MPLNTDERDSAQIESDLRHADEDIRRLAVERIEALPIDRGLRLLVDRLGDPSWRVRKSAVERLIASSDPTRATGALIAALADGENPGRRNAAVEALVQCGLRVVPALLEATASPDVDVRKLIVDALAGIGDARANARLLELLTDPDVNVRGAAADALGAIGGAGVAERLLACAVRGEEDSLVRFSALHALSVLEHPVRVADLGGLLDDPVLRASAFDLLGRAPEDDFKAVPVLLGGLTANSRRAREAAMKALLQIYARRDGEEADRLVEELRVATAASPAIVSAAIESLAEADLATRLVLVQFLGLAGAREAVLPILRAGADEALTEVCAQTLARMGEAAEEQVDAAWGGIDATLRCEACRLFGATRGERGAQRLLASIGAAEPELRIAASQALARRRLASAIPQLVRRLEQAASEDAAEREEEVFALSEALIAAAGPEAPGGAAATGQAVDLLCAGIDEADEEVRLASTRILGCIGRPQDVMAVAYRLKDPSARVRRCAVEALARLGPDAAIEPLRLALADESSSVRIAAALALGSSQHPTVLKDLQRLAEDEDPRVRSAAVRSVGLLLGRDGREAHSPAALALIESALADEVLVALAAVETLRAIGGEAARSAQALLERREPELVREAVACVREHGEAQDLDLVLPLIGHPDWSVRAEAVTALAERRRVRSVPVLLRRLETEQDDFVRSAILRALERLEV